MFWFPLQLLSETFLTPRKIQRDIIINILTYSYNIPVTLVRFYKKIETFSTDFWRNTQISNFIKIRPVGAELYHADGQTHKHTGGRDEVVFFFCNFTNAPKNSLLLQSWINIRLNECVVTNNIPQEREVSVTDINPRIRSQNFWIFRRGLRTKISRQ